MKIYKTLNEYFEAKKIRAIYKWADAAKLPRTTVYKAARGLPIKAECANLIYLATCRRVPLISMVYPQRPDNLR